MGDLLRAGGTRIRIGFDMRVERDHTPSSEEMSISGKREPGDRLDERRFPDYRPAPIGAGVGTKFSRAYAGMP
jgi:hypothetical protein